MGQTLYALLVGINDYPQPVPKLSGCVNDVNAIATLLKNRIASDDLDIQLHTLLDEAATRDAVITAFRQHLGQATQNDLVLFSYSGHGSQEKAPSELWLIAPNGINETLVCWDSRLEGGRDLADKELAKLIAEVAANKPQITILLDCCHSGSGTRAFNSRYIELDQRPRPSDSYLFSLKDVQVLSQTRSLSDKPLSVPSFKGRHILLAACHESETAKEYLQTQRGAFSYFLLETLQQSNSALTYRDAFRRANALIRAQVPQQSPQLEATHEDDLDLYFLSQQKQVITPYFTLSYHSELGWTIDGGTIHSLSQINKEDDDRTRLAIFSFDTPADQLRQANQAVSLAEVIKVLPQLSLVALTENLDPTQVFKAVVTRLPLVKLGVCLEGDATDISAVQASILAAGPEQQPSLYIKPVDTAEQASFRVVAQDGTYQITDLNSLQPLTGKASSCVSATQVVNRLEHMARWTTLVNLAAPATGYIPTNAVQMQLYQDDQEIKSPQIELHYQKRAGRWQQPQFKLKLTNIWSYPLYCSVLDLTERYGISPAFFEAGGVWLRPGESVWANGGKPLYASVPKELWQQGITEYRDIYKLIACTAEFDARLLAQPNLDAPLVRFIPDLSKMRPSLLNQLMRRLNTREVSTTPEEDTFYDDWVTHELSVTTVRPRS